MRRRMQMVFQDPMASLDPRQNVESIISEPLRAHRAEGGRRGHAARVRELLGVVGLPAQRRRALSARVLRRAAPADRDRPRDRARTRS